MSNDFWKQWRPGVLVKEQIERLFDEKILIGPKQDIDNSSLDLHLSKSCHEVKGSLKIGEHERVGSVLSSDFREGDEIKLSEPRLLKQGHTYIIALQEELRKSPEDLQLCGVATGKSSIGRIDVLARLLMDECDSYDRVPLHHHGLLYVEVTPITFPIVVQENDSLNQLRLFRGSPGLSQLSKDEVKLYGDLIITERDISQLSLDLRPVDVEGIEASAFTTTEIEFTESQAITLSKRKHLDPRHYWKPLVIKESDSLQIRRDYFYLLRSRERFRLPPDIAVYCPAISENIGEIRIHYAGFVHPHFGTDRDDGNEGTPLIFEVRSHTMDAFLREGELLANVEFYRTSKAAEKGEQSFNNQELKLAPFFKPWNQ